MVGEIHLVSAMTLERLRSATWTEPDCTAVPRDKAGLLGAWDALTEQLTRTFPSSDPLAFSRQHSLPWGTMPGWVAAIYTIDNEVHHRAQGYVYLRALGIEPPAFYER